LEKEGLTLPVLLKLKRDNSWDLSFDTWRWGFCSNRFKGFSAHKASWNI